MSGLIIIIGGHSHLRTGLLMGLLSSKTNGIVVIDDQTKNEDVFNLVPQKIDFDLDEKRHYGKCTRNNYREVQKRNAFFNKRKH